jgi:Fe-S cluster assembly iron-binding protein IscA
MLTLTDNAQFAIRSLTGSTDAPDGAGVRIATTAGNDSEAPHLELAVVPEPAPGDQVVDQDGARVYLDSAAALMLEAETLDAQVDPAAQEVNFFVS